MEMVATRVFRVEGQGDLVRRLIRGRTGDITWLIGVINQFTKSA